MSAALPSLALCLCCLLALSDCQRRRVESLPRLNFQPSFRQYSGYLNSIDNRRLFYWLVESSHVPPSSAPLVLWMNGGPGCSSVGGLLMTNGPFLANDRAELDRNEFAWNRLANVLYIDSPSGVGLSEPGPIDKSVLNDNVTTQLNLAALLHFYSLFPEYRGRPFYIAGESYAGIYIPLLASAIVSSGRHPQLINLTGIAVGNGLHVPYNATLFDRHRQSLIYAMGADIGKVGANELINRYNVAQACYRNGKVDGYPCLNSTGLTAYLNDRHVRRALGVSDSWPAEFKICNMQIFSVYVTAKDDVLRPLLELEALNKSTLLYHGTLDLTIPLGVTLRLLDRLPMGPKTVWLYCLRKPGYGLQIGGVQRSFGRLRHRTVIGAGHSVSTDRPEIGLQILKDLLADGDAESDSCDADTSQRSAGQPAAQAAARLLLSSCALLSGLRLAFH